MSLKFGLGGPNKNKSLPQRKPPSKSISAFGLSDNEDEPKDPLEDAQTKSSKKSKQSISLYGDLASQRSHRQNVEKALEVDPSVYDYDGAWDAIKAKEEAKKAADKEIAEQGKSKYMENLLAAKEVREKDYLRAKEKKYQREREEEGDVFDDKEKFVTGGYKKQQEELRRQEVEEKKREELEMKKREKDGKRNFLNRLLEQGDQKHHDMVTATVEADKTHPDQAAAAEIKKTDVQIAKELNQKGANIVLTDDGEVADKRQLLSAGLNVMTKPKAKAGQQNHTQQSASINSYSMGKAGNSRAARERQSRMLENQLEQMMKRQADDEADERRQEEHAAKSRKTTSDISSARERYLQRKKAAAGNATAVSQENST